MAALFADGVTRLVPAFLSDVGELASRAATALKTMPWPKTFNGWLTLSASEWLRLIPLLSILAALATAWLSGGRREKPTYERTRIVVLRGLGICYFCGFLTAAFQGPALYGEFGLGSPGALDRSTRPTPAYWLADKCGIHGDAALETVAWAGVLGCSSASRPRRGPRRGCCIDVRPGEAATASTRAEETVLPRRAPRRGCLDARRGGMSCLATRAEQILSGRCSS